jgi:hypothetical protein
MRNIHLLALDVPNLLPKEIPWIGLPWGKGDFFTTSEWPRHGGRLIWATIMFIGGLVIAYALIKRPKKSAEPATWAETFLGAMLVWAMLTLGYGVIPHEWLNFGNSYLNFDSSSFLLHKNGVIPFDITLDKFVDAIAAVIYVIVLGLNIFFFAAWQKRKVAEPATEGEDATVTPITGGGPFSRLRREKRTSAYGRPVTTTSE